MQGAAGPRGYAATCWKGSTPKGRVLRRQATAQGPAGPAANLHVLRSISARRDLYAYAWREIVNVANCLQAHEYGEERAPGAFRIRD